MTSPITKTSMRRIDMPFKCKTGLIVTTVLVLQVSLIAQIPQTSSGTLRRFERFSSTYVAARNVDVWLPKGYDPQQKYAVLYMQDGRSLYDSAIMWNRQEWGVDEVMSGLLDKKRIINCIVVGIWNSEETRHNEYLPQKPFEKLRKSEQASLFSARRFSGQPVFKRHAIWSDAYLKFMVKELKPFIDSVFATYPDRSHTFISGSSMGALISLYALCEYPDVFGGAACLSTHWTGIFRTYNNPFPAAMLNYLSRQLPSPRTHKIYFDYGTAAIDSLYQRHQPKVDALMRKKGYNSTNWITRKFPGADHSEKAWNSRLSFPLLFLLENITK